jgi:hypothetical protein
MLSNYNSRKWDKRLLLFLLESKISASTEVSLIEKQVIIWIGNNQMSVEYAAELKKTEIVLNLQTEENMGKQR